MLTYCFAAFGTHLTWVQIIVLCLPNSPETFANQYEAEKKQTLEWYFGRMQGRSKHSNHQWRPSPTSNKIGQRWAITSQLHCLQYFLLTRIECRLLGLVLVPHHSWVLSHFPWQRCKRQCWKCDGAVVQTEVVWCCHSENMAFLAYTLVWCAFTMKNYAQDSLIHLGDTRCSQWFRKVWICNKPKTGDR